MPTSNNWWFSKRQSAHHSCAIAKRNLKSPARKLESRTARAGSSCKAGTFENRRDASCQAAKQNCGHATAMHTFRDSRRQAQLQSHASTADLAASVEEGSTSEPQRRLTNAALANTAEAPLSEPARQRTRPAGRSRTREFGQEDEVASRSAKQDAGAKNGSRAGRSSRHPYLRTSATFKDLHWSAEDEERASEPGYVHQLLSDSGLLLPCNMENIRHNSFVLNNLLIGIHSWQGILHAFRDLRHYSDNVSTATAMHRLAKLSCRAEADLDEIRSLENYSLLLKVVRKKFKGMKSRAKANIFWALATLREGEQGGILDHCIEIVEEEGINLSWKSQELSNTAWALSTLGRRPIKLLTHIAKATIASDSNQFHPQAIANLAWAFAALDFGQRPGEEGLKDIRAELFNNLAEGSWHRMSDFDPQAVSNTIWSFGNAGIYHQKLCQYCTAEAMGYLHSCKEQEMSNTLIGLSKLNAVEPALIEKLEEEILASADRRFPRMKHQVLSNVLWCLATIRHYSDAIMSSFTPEIVRRMPRFDYREVSVIMWAIAKLGYNPGQELLDAFNQYALKNLKMFNAQSSSNILWALAVLQAPHLSCYQKFIDHLGTMDIEQVDVVQLHQLFQALLLANIERKPKQGSTTPPLRVPKDVMELTTRVWKRLQGRFTVSDFHRDVSERLSELGIEHVQEYQAERGLFSIDIAFSGPGNTRVAMEVDGPYHFTRNTLKPLGSTLLRQRLLQAMGWSVVSIASHEYFQCASARGKYDYIAEQLLGINIQIDPDRIEKAVEGQAAKELQAATAVLGESLEISDSSRAGTLVEAEASISRTRARRDRMGGFELQKPMQMPSPRLTAQSRRFGAERGGSGHGSATARPFQPTLRRGENGVHMAAPKAKRALRGPAARTGPAGQRRVPQPKKFEPTNRTQLGKPDGGAESASPDL